jgi:hypothetical protein
MAYHIAAQKASGKSIVFILIHLDDFDGALAATRGRRSLPYPDKRRRLLQERGKA